MKKMRRQTPKAVMMLAYSLRSIRLTAWRRALSLALSLTLVLVPLLGLGNGRMTAKAKAQDIIICGDAVPPLISRVIQPCHSSLTSIHANNLENEVINNLLTAHELPAEDKSRLLNWERNLIRAGLFNKILGYIQKPAPTRTESEQFFVTKLTELVKQRRILAATKALDEYNRWANNPCTFIAPAGFSYTLHCSCFNQFCGIFEGPTPPSFEEFQNYGASIAYADFQTKPDLQAIAGDTARNFGILGGFAAVGLAGVIGGAVGASLTVSSVVIAAIHPFLAAAVAGTNSAAAVAGVSGVAAGVTGAVSIAAVAAIVVLAIVIGVLQGIDVFTSAAIPGKLQQAKDSAINTNIDLSQLVMSAAGKREVYAEFIQETLPEASGTTEIPAATAGDRQFLLEPGDTVTPTLQYKDWSGTNRSARLSGGWFVDREGSTGTERLTLSIKYLDWEGKGWTASRVGKQFLHTRSGDETATPVKSPEIKYKNWSNAQSTASINNAAPTIIPASATARQGAQFNASQTIASVSDQDDPTPSLTVSVISENPSNGVTVSLFSQTEAFVTASCTASDTSFTLKVTDPGGKSATGILNVTVTENEAPKLGYLTPPSVVVGNSLSFSPFTPPSDPDGVFPPTIGTPTVSPNTFTGTVTVDRFGDEVGTVRINNAGPPGLYSVTVPATDGCTTINAGFSLNVACAAITAAVSGGGMFCPGSSSTVAVNVTGGTAPYTVKLSDGQMKTSSSLPITFNVSPSSLTTYTATATDAYGCPATVTGSATATPDTIAPTITASARKADNTAYVAGTWTNQSVTVDFTCGDNCQVASCPTDVVLIGSGVTNSVSGMVSDSAGNTASTSFGPVMIDKVAPTITCPADINASSDPGQNIATLNPVAPLVADDRSGATAAGVRSDGKPLSAPYPLGVTTILWTATDGAGNTATCTQRINVTTTADLTISQTASASPASVFQTLTYTFIVTNRGPSPAHGVTFSDTLPNKVVFLDVVSNSSCTYSSAEHRVSCNLGTLSPSGYAVIKLMTRVISTGILINTGTVGANGALTTDPMPGNNAMTNSVTARQ